MITFGKPAGNGYPLAGVIVAREIAAEFSKHNAGYFNTFGGNTVAVAAGEVQGLRHHFGPNPRISQPCATHARGVQRALLGGHGYGRLMGACDPML